MARDKAKGEDKGKARGKKLTVKKEPIKDLEASKAKDVKGGVFPVSDSPLRKRF